MLFFINNFKWIMLISGLLTITMLHALFFPEASLQSNFGQITEGNLSKIIVQNWGALIGLMGIMLIYGAFKKAVRSFVLFIAGSSKMVFIILVLTAKENFMGYGAGTAVIADSIMIALYLIYLLTSFWHKSSNNKI